MANSTEEIFGQDLSSAFLFCIIAFKCVCLLLGILGNTFVLIHRLYLNQDRSPTSYLVMNLAFTDVVSCSVLYTSWTAKSTETLQNMNKLHKFCVFNVAFAYLFVTVSFLTLAAITVDKYIYISRPLHHIFLMTAKRTFLMIAASWGCASIYVPVIVVFYQPGDSRYLCQPKNTRSLLFGCVIFNVVPISAVVILNYKIHKIAHHQRQRIGQVNRDTRRRPASVKFVRELKNAKTFAIAIGALIACYTPFFAVYLTAVNICGDCVTPELLMITVDVAAMNSILNPFIYSIRHAEYRVGLRKLLAKITCK